MLIQDVVNRTAEVFEKDLVVPEPAIHWHDKLVALEEANLTSQHSACLFDMRCEQAETMGFVRADSANFVEMLMGEPHTDRIERTDLSRQNHEWMYNHHTGVTHVKDNCNWGGQPIDFVKFSKPSQWWLAPFCKKEMWRCRLGRLNYLKRTIPYGVVLRMNELRELNLFNAFNVLAPQEAWERKTDIDPIVVATIWEISNNQSEQAAHFFVAQW